MLLRLRAVWPCTACSSRRSSQRSADPPRVMSEAAASAVTSRAICADGLAAWVAPWSSAQRRSSACSRVPRTVSYFWSRPIRLPVSL